MAPVDAAVGAGRDAARTAGGRVVPSAVAEQPRAVRAGGAGRCPLRARRPRPPGGCGAHRHPAPASPRLDGRPGVFPGYRLAGRDRPALARVVRRMTRLTGLAATILVIGLGAGTAADRPRARPVVTLGAYRVLAADFHVHSAAWSDGALTPFGLVVEADRQGLDAMAVTGHNQVSDAKV